MIKVVGSGTPDWRSESSDTADPLVEAVSALAGRIPQSSYSIKPEFSTPSSKPLSAVIFNIVPPPSPADALVSNQRDRKLGRSELPIRALNQSAAEKNHLHSWVLLGTCFLRGVGGIRDPIQAVSYFLKAAEQGHAEAQFRLGYCYYKGEGVSQNIPEAIKWLQKAAEQKHAPAQCILGLLYSIGKGVEQNSETGVKWFNQAAQQGYAPAQCELAKCYKIGEGVAKNIEEAVRWFRRSAEQGYLDAQRELAKVK